MEPKISSTNILSRGSLTEEMLISIKHYSKVGCKSTFQNILGILCAIFVINWLYMFEFGFLSPVHDSCCAQPSERRRIHVRTETNHDQTTMKENMRAKIISVNRPYDNVKRVILHGEPASGTLHVVITLSNPAGYQSRWSLGRQMIQGLRDVDQGPIEVYVAELAYGDKPFCVAHSNDSKHLQLRTTTPLWHKENLINLVVERLLPKDWKALAWLDGEVEFESPTWAADTLQLLNEYDILQLFSHSLDLGPAGEIQRIYTGYAYNQLRNITYQKRGVDLWHPGYAWACSRKAYDQIGGLFEGNILGGGDQSFAYATSGMHRRIDPGQRKIFPSAGYYVSIMEWEERFQGLRVGYVPGIIRHKFHGSVQDRRYWDRRDILSRAAFNPRRHITRDKFSGVIVPTKSFPSSLATDILAYFKDRNEDNQDKGTQVRAQHPSARPGQLRESCSLHNVLTEKGSAGDLLHVIVVVRSPISDTEEMDSQRVLTDEYIANMYISKDAVLHVVEVAEENIADARFLHPKSGYHNRLQVLLPPGRILDDLYILGTVINFLSLEKSDMVAYVEEGIYLDSGSWISDTLRLLKNGTFEVVHLYGLMVEIDVLGNTRHMSTSFGFDIAHDRCLHRFDGNISLYSSNTSCIRRPCGAYALKVSNLFTLQCRSDVQRREQDNILRDNKRDIFVISAAAKMGYVPGVARRIVLLHDMLV